VTPWVGWHPRTGSLRCFLLWWLLGGLWLGVAAITLWQAGSSTAQRAQAQDERLAHVLAQVAQHGTPSMAGLLKAVRPAAGEVAWGPPLYRLDAMNGDWLSGDRELAPYPWRAGLSAAGAPALYIGQVRGTLVRAAAAVRHVGADGGRVQVVVQVAAPWRERLPGWRELFVESPLRWVYGLAALMSLVVWSGVEVALRWLGQVDGLLHEVAGDAGR
jgi:two-component system sensor histidine kinase TctE